MEAQFTKEDALVLIKETAARLGRLPKKSDFPPQAVARIKAFWGPWRRVLEAAALLPVKEKRPPRGAGQEGEPTV